MDVTRAVPARLARTLEEKKRGQAFRPSPAHGRENTAMAPSSGGCQAQI